MPQVIHGNKPQAMLPQRGFPMASQCFAGTWKNSPVAPLLQGVSRCILFGSNKRLRLTGRRVKFLVFATIMGYKWFKVIDTVNAPLFRAPISPQ